MLGTDRSQTNGPQTPCRLTPEKGQTETEKTQFCKKLDRNQTKARQSQTKATQSLTEAGQKPDRSRTQGDRSRAAAGQQTDKSQTENRQKLEKLKMSKRKDNTIIFISKKYKKNYTFCHLNDFLKNNPIITHKNDPIITNESCYLPERIGSTILTQNRVCIAQNASKNAFVHARAWTCVAVTEMKRCFF